MFTRSLTIAACAAALLCTSAGHARAATARADVVHTSVRVAGKPFFPIMLIDQCGAAAAARARSLGVNLILNESCPGLSPADQLAQLAGKELAVLPIQARGVSGARLAGWTYPDEPEDNGWTPARLARAFSYPRGSDDGLVSFVTTTSAFLHGRARASTTRSFARLADVAGFDLYPLNHCQPNLATVYDAQRAFVQSVGAMPTFQWIETGPIDRTYCGGFRMTPAQLRAEAWLAIVGGARGIGFFTHTVEPASDFGTEPDVAHAIQRFASLADAVKPGLLGTTIGSSSDSRAIKVLSRRAGTHIYVFAVNALAQGVRAQLTVPGLGSGSVKAFGERRSVSVSNGQLIDTFGPLAVHVYVR